MTPARGMFEFVALMAFAMSLGALTIDAMLPAFGEMRRDLMVHQANDMQLIVSGLLAGLAFGQLFYGSIVRCHWPEESTVCGLCLVHPGLPAVHAGHELPYHAGGQGAAGNRRCGPRVVVVAMVRDRVHGSAMARVMSFIMSFFILVPIIAPAMGQAILLIAGWRAIFGTLMVLALSAWFGLPLRQPETLHRGAAFAAFPAKNSRGICDCREESPGHGVHAGDGLYFRCLFLAYLNLCQQIFQVQYGLGRMFPLYFALLALAVGLASLLNSSMVMRLGMHYLTRASLLLLSGLSWVFLALTWFHAGQPPLGC